MKAVAVLEIDPATGALGLASRIAEDFHGETVLRATVRGLLEYAETIDEVAILHPSGTRDRLAGRLDGMAVSFHETGPDDPHRPLWRRGRKWALSSWRGGLGNASVLDEWGTPATLRRVLAETGADALVKVSVLNPFVDGELIDAFVRRARETKHEVSLMLTPPGFHFEYYRAPFLDDLLARGIQVRSYLALYLDRTNRDPVLTEHFFRADEALIEGRFRVSADSARSLEIARDLRRVLEPGPRGFRGVDVQSTLLARPEIWHRRIPREIEVEVTGRDDLPRPQRPRPRPDVDLPFAVFENLVDEAAAAYDDVVLTLGGHGEPLLVPDLPAWIRRAREAGIWGVHLETNGLALEGDLARELLDSGLDVVTIRVDAQDPEVYRRLNGAGALDRIRANADAFAEASAARGPDLVWVVPEMIKRPETMNDLEPFFERWFAKTGWVVLRPANEYCGQLEDVNPLPLFLSNRTLCQKIQNSLVVHADGRVPVCTQDYLGRWPAGDLATSTLEEIWTGPILADLRRAHGEGRFDTFELCPGCRYWQSV